MANTARYASRTATYGSVAYDLESLKRNFAVPSYSKPETYREPETESTPAVKERAHAHAHVAAESAVSISAFSVVGFLAAAMLLVFVVLSYVQITEINAAKSELRNQLSELTTEATMLRVAYESTFNINEIEDYAENTLGMVRLSQSDVAAVSIERQDMGVVLSENAAGEGNVLTGLAEHLRSLLEYFK